MQRNIFHPEPTLPGLEFEYRQYYLRRDIDQVVTAIVLWMAAYLAFIYSDYIILGATVLFQQIAALRIAYFIISLLLVFILKKWVSHFQQYDRLVLVWLLCSLLCNIGIGRAEPQNYFSEIILSLVAIFSFYIFIPNPIGIRVIPALVYSVYMFLVTLVSHRGISPAFVEAMAFCYLITNLAGILFSTRLYVSRRQKFMATQDEEKNRTELQRLASTDPLTGVLNRRRLLQLAGETFYRFRRYRRPFTIIVMDLDGFKNINDTLGHQQGDAVLVEFAEAVSREKREADALGRMGGDEFCLVLPETLPQAAAALAGRIIKKCEEIMPGGVALEVNMTVSIGISAVRPEDSTLDALFARADAALYKAKNGGRNRYVIA